MIFSVLSVVMKFSCGIGKYRISHPIPQGGVGEIVSHDWGVLSDPAKGLWRGSAEGGLVPLAERKSALVPVRVKVAF